VVILFWLELGENDGGMILLDANTFRIFSSKNAIQYIQTIRNTFCLQKNLPLGQVFFNTDFIFECILKVSGHVRQYRQITPNYL
jgi:hypothetical protein